jgi:hypothetical protein
MPLAEMLASELGIPWALVNPGCHFRDDACRRWEADYPASSPVPTLVVASDAARAVLHAATLSSIHLLRRSAASSARLTSPMGVGEVVRREECVPERLGQAIARVLGEARYPLQG